VIGSRRHRTGLVHTKAKPLPSVRSEINVTPLVDVCLVLLIIFMVITPMLQRGRDVPLPKTKNFEEKRDTGDKPIVSVAIIGGKPTYWFDKDRIEGATIEEQMATLSRKTEDLLAKKATAKIDAVFFKADANLKFGDVYPALIAIQKGSMDNVELGVWEMKQE
jgi:biopolymer transport protein ExbD